MSFSELWNDIRGNLIWAGVAALGAVVWSMSAHLVKGLRPWQRRAIHAIIGFLLILSAVLAVKLEMQPSRPMVTPENIEGKIRFWLDEFGINSGKVADEHAFFNYQATAPNTPPVAIAREKDHPQYLAFGASISLSKDDQAVYDRLSEDERQEFRMLLGAELAKARVSSIPNLDHPEKFFPLMILARAAITPDFTESTFYRGVEQVDYGVIIANNTIELFLARFKTRQPSPTPNTEASPH
jgi:hypothetical protein